MSLIEFFVEAVFDGKGFADVIIHDLIGGNADDSSCFAFEEQIDRTDAHSCCDQAVKDVGIPPRCV